MRSRDLRGDATEAAARTGGLRMIFTPNFESIVGCYCGDVADERTRDPLDLEDHICVSIF